MKSIVLSITLLCASSVYAATDYKCLNDCTGHGYMYNYCLSQCSYNNPFTQQQTQPQPLDFGAINNARKRAQEDIQGIQDIEAARARNRLLQLQLQEAEAQAAERAAKRQEQKGTHEQEPEPGE